MKPQHLHELAETGFMLTLVEADAQLEYYKQVEKLRVMEEYARMHAKNWMS